MQPFYYSIYLVPRSAVENTTFKALNYTEDSMVNVSYNIPVRLRSSIIILYLYHQVIIQCTGEAPENVVVTIKCGKGDILYNDTTEVEYARQPRDITGSVSVPQYEQCNISIVFSNAIGSSEPFVKAIG